MNRHFETPHGLLTVSDGRPAVHRDLAAFATEVESQIATAIERSGHTVVRGDSRGVAARSNHVETGLDERERGCLPDA